MSDSTSGPDSTDESMISILREIRDEVARLGKRVDQLTHAVGRFEQRSPAIPTAPTPVTGEMTEEALRLRIREAMNANDPYGVLDHRQPLALLLSADELTNLDRELATWFGRYFQWALRSGQALVIAGAMERAVAELTPLPEIEPLADALPLVRRTIGVWEENLRRQDDEDFD
jgi:hypothetical protein